MILGCIDIGSNTTRLLVAEVADGRLRELVVQRAFTRIGKTLSGGAAIPPEKIAETAEVVASQSRIAREVGAQRIVTVATAAIRGAPNRDIAMDFINYATRAIPSGGRCSSSRRSASRARRRAASWPPGSTASRATPDSHG